MQNNANTIDEWFTARRFSLLLALIITASFPKVLLGLETFVVRDYGFFAYPIAHYIRESFWRGELPLWNPLNNCGIPLLAQWNTMVLYPPSLLYLLLPLGWSLSFFCLLHLFWAGLGMYFLAFRWTNNRLAASMAGLIFAFNGLSLNFLMWPSHAATYSWMPWVVFAVEAGWRQGGRKIILAALAGALQMLAGGPETILLTWIFLFALCTLEAFQKQQSPMRLFLRFTAIVLLLAGIAAIQLLPFLELAAHSQRVTGYADTRWAMPGWGWANFLVPMFYGEVWEMGVFFQFEQSWTSSYYVGIGTLLLALLAGLKWRERRIMLLLGIAAVALLLSFGGNFFFYRAIRSFLPQLSIVTYPVKFVILVVFVLSILAAFGITHVRSEKNQSTREIFFPTAVLLLLIGGIVFFAWRFPYGQEDWRPTFYNGSGRAVLLLLFCGAMIALRRTDHFKSSLALSLFLLAVAWFDVQTHEPPQNPTVPKWIYQPGLAKTRLAMNPQPALGESRAMVTPFAALKFRKFILTDQKDNLLVKRLGYFADCNLLDDIPKTDGFFSLFPREMDEVDSLILTNQLMPRLMDFLSISQVTAPGKHFDWQSRSNFLPMITAGQKPAFVSASNSLSVLANPGWNPRTTVFLPENESAFVKVTNATNVRILSSHFTAHRVKIETESSEPALVVISQTFYPQWRAKLDGQPTRLLRANHAFQAVEVPGGKHTIELVYRDKSFRTGAVISFFSLAICAIVWRKKKLKDF